MHASQADDPVLVRDNRGMAGCDRCGAEIPRDAHFCPICGAPVAAERPVEERKLATVLFADLVGSTALAGSQLSELFGRQLELRIGVNTGDVVVGQARAGSSFVSGDAVNVAARLE